MPKKDLLNQKFQRLTVIEELPERTARGKIRWRCICTCGTEVITTGDNLQSGNTKSCGCWDRESAADRLRTHGQSGKNRSPTYQSWASMIQRCTYEKHSHYKNYGGRGITVCERWRSFENFLADMGERPEGTTIDRYPNSDGDYEPGNCRWATRSQQNKNRRKRS